MARASVLLASQTTLSKCIERRTEPCIAVGYSMTLFQSLATQAGWDPVRGKGSSCSGANASGQCVLPWAGGTKSISSIVLVASGLSFAVSESSTADRNPSDAHNRCYTDHDSHIHDDRFRCRLWYIRTLAAPGRHNHMLDCSICEHIPHEYVSIFRDHPHESNFI